LLILKETEVCPYMFKCEYANDCQGTNVNRKSIFNCDYVKSNGVIEAGKPRNFLDETGRMEVLNE
jgi:hypothetical protein